MQFKEARAELALMRTQRNFALIIGSLFGIALICSVAGWFYVLQHEKTIIIPIGLEKPFSYSRHEIAASYLEELASFLAL